MNLPTHFDLLTLYHSEFKQMSQNGPSTESLGPCKIQTTQKNPESSIPPPPQSKPSKIPRPSSLPRYSTTSMNPPDAKETLASRFPHEKNHGKGTRSPSRRSRSSDSDRRPIQGASGVNSVQAVGEVIIHGDIASSGKADSTTFPSTGPSASPDDSGLNATEKMFARLEVEFPSVRKYAMEPPRPKIEMNRKWVELEDYCTTQTTVKESESEYTLFNTDEYYPLNRLTLWVSQNKHKHETAEFPPNYLPGIRLTDDDVRWPKE